MDDDGSPAHAPTAAAAAAAARRRRLLAAGLVVLVLALGASAAVIRHEPDFYRAALAVDPSRAESLARRMVSKASSLHAAVGRQGTWDGVISADELNAWLATDLPRNHSRLLPRGITAPRVAFVPRHVLLAARTGFGPFSAVVWADIEVRLQGVNQIGIMVHRAGIGGFPLPGDAMLRRFAGHLREARLVADLRRLDGGMLLVVSPPAAYDAARGWRLESLAVETDELLVAGSTARGAKGADE